MLTFHTNLRQFWKPWWTIWSAYIQCQPHCYRFNKPCKVDLPVSIHSSVGELKLEGKYLWKSYWNLCSCCNICSSTSQSDVYLCHKTCDAFLLPEIREANYYWNEWTKNFAVRQAHGGGWLYRQVGRPDSPNFFFLSWLSFFIRKSPP